MKPKPCDISYRHYLKVISTISLLRLICFRQFKPEMFEVAAAVASFSQVLFIQVLTSHFVRDVKGSIDSKKENETVFVISKSFSQSNLDRKQPDLYICEAFVLQPVSYLLLQFSQALNQKAIVIANYALHVYLRNLKRLLLYFLGQTRG